MLNDNRKLGIGLTGCGCLFLFLGMLLFFDKALLALGNVLFLAGITLLIGTRKTLVFFFRKSKRRGTACFAFGIILVLINWPVIGMLIEIFGIFNLFGNFFPIVISILRGFPIIGNILNAPGVSRFVDKFAGSLLPTTVSRQE
jgi:hypothetical protein